MQTNLVVSAYSFLEFFRVKVIDLCFNLYLESLLLFIIDLLFRAGADAPPLRDSTPLPAQSVFLCTILRYPFCGAENLAETGSFWENSENQFGRPKKNVDIILKIS